MNGEGNYPNVNYSSGFLKLIHNIFQKFLDVNSNNYQIELKKIAGGNRLIF